MPQFSFTPSIGGRYDMRSHSDYSAAGIPNWHWFTVVSIAGETAQVISIPDNYVALVPVKLIQPPFGWHDRYTIHVSPEKVTDVLSWLPRGIAVRACHDLARAGDTVFQPADNCDVPHWAYPGEPADIVPPEQTLDRIKIVKLETVHSAFVMRPCPHCISGTRTPENNPAMEAWLRNVKHCPRCGVAMGFSFTEPFHDMLGKYGGLSTEPAEALSDLNQNTPCPEVHPAGWCFVCQGTAMAPKYIADMATKPARRGQPSERIQALAELRAAGWTVHYDRHIQSWIGERETIVKDFGREPVSR